MTDERFFSYKSLIYEPNLTKFQTNMGTIAAHKPCEFQEYRLRKSPLRSKKVAKIVIFKGGFLTGNPQIWADRGPIWQGVVGNPKKSHFNNGSSMPAIKMVAV